MIKITCEVKDYSKPAKSNIFVHSDWADNRMVEIEVDGKRQTVLGYDLIEAIKNCMNTNVNG